MRAAWPGSIWLSWNARSLGHSVRRVRQRKMELLMGLARRAQVIMLQEKRMLLMDMRRAMREFSGTHWLVVSGETESSGGVVVLVSKHICDAMPRSVEHVRGRVLEVSFASVGDRLDLFVVHTDCELGNAESRAARRVA